MTFAVDWAVKTNYLSVLIRMGYSHTVRGHEPDGANCGNCRIVFRADIYFMTETVDWALKIVSLSTYFHFLVAVLD